MFESIIVLVNIILTEACDGAENPFLEYPSSKYILKVYPVERFETIRSTPL